MPAALLLFIIQNRRPLLVMTIAAFAISVAVSLLITPRYRSTVILYPASFTGTSRTISGSSPAGSPLTEFGREADTERLLQVLNSEPVKRRIVEKYDLMNHYNISGSIRYPYTALNRKFANNVRFRKNRYMAVEIEVLDTDPRLAASMANDIARLADSVMASVIRSRASATLAIAGAEYMRLRDEIAMLEDSLAKIRRLGVINYEAQSQVMNSGWASAVLAGDSLGAAMFGERLRLLSSFGGAYVSLRDNLELKNEKLADVKQAYDMIRLDAEQPVPLSYVIDEAVVAEKKAYPVRSVIVGVSTASAFLFTLFMLLLVEAFRRELEKVPVKK